MVPQIIKRNKITRKQHHMVPHVISQLITKKQHHMVPYVIPQLITRKQHHMVPHVSHARFDFDCTHKPIAIITLH
jgi:hypothetical protein